MTRLHSSALFIPKAQRHGEIFSVPSVIGGGKYGYCSRPLPSGRSPAESRLRPAANLALANRLGCLSARRFHKRVRESVARDRELGLVRRNRRLNLQTSVLRCASS